MLKKIQSVQSASGKMSKLFIEYESYCYKNLKNIQENINSVKFIRSEKDLPGQDLTVNHLFLTDKDLGKRCAQLLVNQISCQHKLFILMMKDLNLLWHESDASDFDLRVTNDGIACISVKGRESVIKCESLVKLTDELLKVTGFVKLPLLEGKAGCEVDDESDNFHENSPVSENRTTRHCEDLDSLLSTPRSETCISSPGFINDDNASDYVLNSKSGNSESDEFERKESRVVDGESDSSESVIFRDPSPVIENKTVQDCEDLDSLLSTHRSETDFSFQGVVNDDNASDCVVNPNSDNSERDESDGNVNRVVNDESHISVSVIFSELTPVSGKKTTHDCEDLDLLLSAHRSKTETSSQSFVNDDNGSDYVLNSKSDNSESDEFAWKESRVVDGESDSSESVIFRDPFLVNENKTVQDCEDLDSLLSTHRSETDVSSQGVVNDDNASDYVVNPNSDNSERDESEGNVNRVVDDESHSSVSVIFPKLTPVSEKRTTHDCEDLDLLLSAHRSQTDTSSQNFVNDDNGSDYVLNSKSDNSESDEFAWKESRVVESESDSSESVIFRDPSPVNENMTVRDCEDLDSLLSTHRSETDVSFQGVVNDDNASDYVVNPNSDNSERDESEGNVDLVVDDESHSSVFVIFPEHTPVSEYKTTQDCEDLDSLLSTHRSEIDVSSQNFVNDNSAIDYFVNSNSDDSAHDESEGNVSRVVDDESDSSEPVIFPELSPLCENKTTQDCKDLDSLLSTHRPETDVSSQCFVNDENARDYAVNSNSDNFESAGSVDGVVDDESDSSESVIFPELTSVSEDKTTQDSKDLDPLSSTHRSETDISSQGLVDDDNASDYSVNSSSENSESDESEGHVGHVVDDESDSSESDIFPELTPVSKNKTTLDCELLSTDRFKTDISSQGFANDDNARDYSVNSNSDNDYSVNSSSENSESDESEGNIGRVVDDESDSSESVVFREPSPISENKATQDLEAYKGINKSSLSQSQSVSASLYEKGYTLMRETVLQKYNKLRQYYLKNRSSLKGNVVIVYTSTTGIIKTVSCATILEARQKAYSLHGVSKDPFPVVFIRANKIKQNSSTVRQEKTPSILGTLHSEQREFPHFKFYIDTGADEGSVGFNPDIIKDFVFTVANINGSLEPAVLCKFNSECTESEDVHVFDVDKESNWNAIGFSHLEKCVMFLDMKNNICLLRKHRDVTRWETEEETKIIFKKAS